MENPQPSSNKPGRIFPIPETAPRERSVSVAAHDVEPNMVNVALRRASIQSNNGMKTERVTIAVVEPFAIETRSTIGSYLLGHKASRLLLSAMKGPSGVFFWSIMVVAICLSMLRS